MIRVFRGLRGGGWARAFMLLVLIVLLSGCAPADPAGQHPMGDRAGESLVTVDYQRLVARADLRFDKTFDISDHGLPIGSGTMGSLIWTSPNALKFQINRSDVYANGCETNSFYRRHHDYAYGCGFVDIELVDFGAEVFPQSGTRQHLSVYDGLATISGADVTTESTAWQGGDVFAVRVDDRRAAPSAIRAKLRTMRPRAVHTRHHRAISDLLIRGGQVVLRQTFREDGYYAASAVVLALSGRPAQPRLNAAGGGRVTLPYRASSPGLAQPTETEIELVAKPARGAMTVWIASAASRDPKEDVVAKARGQLDAAMKLGYAGVRRDNAVWWRDFWSKSFVHLTSEDGAADEVERNCTYFLYLMASSSRGAYPPNYGGMIFSTRGDYRMWGAQHWWTNMSMYYRGLMGANHGELTEPLFGMYLKMSDSLRRAARQQWGTRGIYVPETVWFDGLRNLPDDIAAEMRELYLLRKPWNERSERFRTYSLTQHGHCSQWNWKAPGTWKNGHWTFPTKGFGPFGHVSHLFSPNAELAYLAWKRYEFSGDRRWLADKAYPLLRGASEFYRNFPTLKKDAKGVYHIDLVNHGEGLWGARDTMEIVGVVRGLLPAAIRASEILSVDPELRAQWGELLKHFTRIPTSDEGHVKLRKGYDGPPVWVTARKPCARGQIGAGLSFGSSRIWELDLWNVETRLADPPTYKTALASYRYRYPDGIPAEAPVHVLSQHPVIAAKLGLADDFRNSVQSLLACKDAANDFCAYEATYRTSVLANRMTLREGINAIGAQRLGTTLYAVGEALCQSNPPRPGDQPTLNLFSAWPKDWDAQFTQAARGEFLVTASWTGGKAEFVEILSQGGQTCRIRNPWPDAESLTIYRNGTAWKTLSGALLTFKTSRKNRYLLIPSGAKPQTLHRQVPVISNH